MTKGHETQSLAVNKSTNRHFDRLNERDKQINTSTLNKSTNNVRINNRRHRWLGL